MREHTQTKGPGTSARPSSSNTIAASAQPNPSVRSENTPVSASSSHIARSKPARTRSMSKRPSQTLRIPSRSATWSSVRSKFTSPRPTALPRQAEHALADDVALDLRGAGRDRDRQRPQPLLDELVVVDVERVAVEHPHRELAEPLARLGVRELDHHRAEARRARARRLRHVALRQRPQRVELGARRGRARAVRPGRATSGASSSTSRIASTISLTNAVPRSNDSVTFVTRHPSFSSPTRFSTGTRTSSRNTSQNSDDPSSVSMRPDLDAGQVHREDEPA